MNRKILLATVAIVALPTSAIAGPRFYVGGNLGAVQSKGTDDYSIPNAWDTYYSTAPVETSSNGFLVGGQIGFDWSVGHSTWGLVADYNALMGANQTRLATWEECGSYCDPTTVKSASKALVSIRARVGFNITEGTTLYGTGGIGWIQVDDNMNVGGGKGGDFHNTKWQPAFVVGGGIEQALDANWSIAGQVLYAQTSSFSQLPKDTSYFTAPTPVYYRNTVTTAMASINYHF